MKNIFIIFLMIILCLSFVNADITDMGNYPQGNCVNLIQSCPDCTYVNITRITYPNATTIIGASGAMTKDDVSYYYTFCNTSMIGTYIVEGKGDPSGVLSTWNYQFDISKTGGSDSYNNFTFFIVEGILVVLLVLVIIGLGAFPALWQRAGLSIALTIILTTILRFTSEIISITNPYATNITNFIDIMYGWGTTAIYLSVFFGVAVCFWYALKALIGKRKSHIGGLR